MKKLSEFKQSADKPIQHQLFGGQEAHKRFNVLERVFASAGHELAKPVHGKGADGSLQISFLTKSANMPSNALSSVDGTEYEQAFEKAFEDISFEAKKRGVSPDWIGDIRENCRAHYNGSKFAFAWGMQFYPPTKVKRIILVDPPPPLRGCTDPEAINYNPLAKVDDGSCQYPSEVLGCLDPQANNYNPNATVDDGSCTYDPKPDANPTPSPTPALGPDQPAEIRGCTDPRAINYQPEATVNDGSCIYPVYGCTDPGALNYNKDATHDDGSCLYPGGRNSSRAWWMWILLALLLLLFALLLLCVDGCNGAYAAHGHRHSPLTGRFEPNPLPGFTPDQSNSMVPIPEEDIVTDPVTGNQIAKGRVNVYPKIQEIEFSTYLQALQEAVGDSDIEVTDYCHETRRVQLDIGDRDFGTFKAELRSKLGVFEPLIWPEVLYPVSFVTESQSELEGIGNWHIEAVNAEGSLDKFTGKKAVTVAIVGSGFETQHDGLNQDTTAQYHIVTRTHRVFANQEITHGTHVAGLAIGEASEDEWQTGLGYGCSWMPVQLSEFSESAGLSNTHIVDGILYAINHGADVINLSLGGINPEFILALWQEGGKEAIDELIAYQSDEAQFWNEVYQIGEENNCMFVIAAGNESLPMELDPMQRSEFPIYVAATNSEMELANFSNFPTGNEYTNTPGVCIAAPGDSLYSCAVDGSYMYMSGTSMAAPVAAGALGLLRSVHPHLSNAEIRELLLGMPQHVNSWQKAAWALITDSPIDLMAGQWTFDVTHRKREIITLSFSENGRFTCETCYEKYRRGDWWVSEGEIHVKFYTPQSQTSLDMAGRWTEGAFVGTGFKDGSTPLTFSLSPNAQNEAVHPATAIPFLDVAHLIETAPQPTEL